MENNSKTVTKKIIMGRFKDDHLKEDPQEIEYLHSMYVHTQVTVLLG